MGFLIRKLLSFTRRPKVRFARLMMCNRRNGKGSVRNAQFVGFLESSGFRRNDPVRHERVMSRRRRIVQVVAILLFAGFIWIMLESAHALSLF